MRSSLLGFSFCLLFALPLQAFFPQPVTGDKGMVVSGNPLATKAGLSILKAGGNAVDAAIATTFAISVVEPFSAGIGGGGFALFYKENENNLRALDFRERAPLTASKDMYIKEGQPDPLASRDGYESIAVPGTVYGLWRLHQENGKLPWRKLLGPAILLAERGFRVGWRYEAMSIWRLELLNQNAEAKRIFTDNGKPKKPGSILVQKDLANTLKRVAQEPMDFYRGKIAQRIAQDIANGGGLVTINDLKKYRSIWRKPVCGDFLNHRVCSMPPPSSGGVHLIQILNLLDGEKMKAQGWHHPDALHHLIESMRIAYADRATHLGDPDFHPVPIRSLTSKAYAQKRLAEIDPQKANASNAVNALSGEAMKAFAQRPESPDTSHLTVVDENRLVISITFTINYPFGSGIVPKGTGILLNDEMDDFAIAPGVPNAYGLVGGKANSVQPLKTPLSSMTPFLVTQNGKLAMAGGSPGGSTIITTSLQLILNALVYDMNAAQAIHAPKIHHQWLPDHTDVEPFGLDAATRSDLESRGHTLKNRDPWGNANLIIQRQDGKLEGCADPRAEGEAMGL